MKKQKEKPISNSVVKTDEAKRKHILDQNYTTEMLSGNKRHWCPNWFFEAIDDTMPEFESCKCNLMGID